MPGFAEQHDVGTVIVTMVTPEGNVTHIYPKARASIETRYPDPYVDYSDTFAMPTFVGSDAPVEVTLTLNPYKDEDGVWLRIEQHQKKEIPNE